MHRTQRAVGQGLQPREGANDYIGLLWVLFMVSAGDGPRIHALHV